MLDVLEALKGRHILTMGEALRKKSMIIGHVVIGLHPMLAYSALSGLCEHELSEFD
jgi:hypothetical protein